MTDSRITIRRERIEPSIFAGIMANIFAAGAGFGGAVLVSALLLVAAIALIGIPIAFIRAGRVRR